MFKAFWALPVGKVPEISPQQLNEWLKDNQGVQVIDARTTLEYQQGTIGSAIHAPLTEMPASMERLTFDKASPIVVLCLSGHRSRPGVRWLRARGYDAYSLSGGLMAWKSAGFSVDDQGKSLK